MTTVICPGCEAFTLESRFDMNFRHPVTRENRLAFGIPAALCENCGQLYVDRELLELLDLEDSRCVFAIESDAIIQQIARDSSP